MQNNATPVVDELLREANKLRQLTDGLAAGPTIRYTRAVVDLCRASSRRILALVESIAATGAGK